MGRKKEKIPKYEPKEFFGKGKKIDCSLCNAKQIIPIWQLTNLDCKGYTASGVNVAVCPMCKGDCLISYHGCRTVAAARRSKRGKRR